MSALTNHTRSSAKASGAEYSSRRHGHAICGQGIGGLKKGMTINNSHQGLQSWGLKQKWLKEETLNSDTAMEGNRVLNLVIEI